jgi:hypothetical protein
MFPVHPEGTTVTERPTSTHDRLHDPQHDAQRVANRRANHPQPRSPDDALAALERARRHAFEAQEAERWDGLS